MQFHRALDTQLYQSRLVIYAKQKSNRKILRLCFSGPSGSGDRGVTPVYLRCTQGRVTWKHPRGALRVLLRMPNAVSSTARFRACVRPLKGSGGATVWVEERASLKKMFPEVRVKRGVAPKSECSLSENGQVALFVEMEAGAPDSDLIFYYHLEQLPSTGRYDPEKGKRQFLNFNCTSMCVLLLSSCFLHFFSLL